MLSTRLDPHFKAIVTAITSAPVPKDEVPQIAQKVRNILVRLGVSEQPTEEEITKAIETSELEIEALKKANAGIPALEKQIEELVSELGQEREAGKKLVEQLAASTKELEEAKGAGA